MARISHGNSDDFGQSTGHQTRSGMSPLQPVELFSRGFTPSEAQSSAPRLPCSEPTSSDIPNGGVRDCVAGDMHQLFFSQVNKRMDLMENRFLRWSQQMEQELQRIDIEVPEQFQQMSSLIQERCVETVSVLNAEIKEATHEETRGIIFDLVARVESVERTPRLQNSNSPLSADKILRFEQQVGDAMNKFDFISQQYPDVHARIRELDERLRSMRTVLDTREEHWRWLVERLQSNDLSVRFENFQQEDVRQRAEISGRLEVITKRLDNYDRCRAGKLYDRALEFADLSSPRNGFDDSIFERLRDLEIQVAAIRKHEHALALTIKSDAQLLTSSNTACEGTEPITHDVAAAHISVKASHNAGTLRGESVPSEERFFMDRYQCVHDGTFRAQLQNIVQSLCLVEDQLSELSIERGRNQEQIGRLQAEFEQFIQNDSRSKQSKHGPIEESRDSDAGADRGNLARVGISDDERCIERASDVQLQKVVEAVSAIDERLKELFSDRTRNQERFVVLQKEMATLGTQFVQSTSGTEIATQNTDLLAQTVRTTEERLGELFKDHTVNKDHVVKLIDEVARAQDAVKSLTSQVSQNIKDAVNEMTRGVTESQQSLRQGFESDIDELRARICDNERGLSATSDVYKDLVQRIMELQDSHHSLSRRFELDTDELKTRIGDKEQEQNATSDVHKDLVNRILDLQESHQSLSQRFESGTDELKTRIGDKERELAATSEEHKGLVKRAVELHELHQALNERLESDLKELKTRIGDKEQELNSTLDSHKDLVHRIKELQESNASLRQRCESGTDELRMRISDKERDLASTSKVHEDLAHRIMELQDSHLALSQRFESDTEELKTRICDTERDVDSASDIHKNLTCKITELHGRHLAMSQRATSLLRTRLCDEERDIDATSGAQKHLVNRISELHKSHLALSQRFDALVKAPEKSFRQEVYEDLAYMRTELERLKGFEKITRQELQETVEPMLGTLRFEFNSVIEIVRQELTVLTDQACLMQKRCDSRSRGASPASVSRGEINQYWRFHVPRELQDRIGLSSEESYGLVPRRLSYHSPHHR